MEIDRLTEPMEIEDFRDVFDNRISQNIDDRIEYQRQLILELRLNETKTNHCMRLYKYDENDKPIFRIGNKIILNQRIYTNREDSEDNNDENSGVNGALVYLAKTRIKKINRPFNFVVKIIENSELIETKLKDMKILSNAVIEKKCPHFPILYSVLYCNEFNNFDTSSKSISNSFDNSNNRDIDKYPTYIQIYKDDKLLSILTETANGNFRMFIKENFANSSLLENALAQIYISIMFFYSITGKYYGHAGGDNFLYHRIKPGGYLHYKLFGKSYYIKNLGYLWVLWNFTLVSLYTLDGSEIKHHHQELRYDFKNILFEFEEYYGRVVRTVEQFKFKTFASNNDDEPPKEFNNDFKNKIIDIYRTFFLTAITISNDNINIFLENLIYKLAEHEIILNSLLVINKPKIINKIPYVIKGIEGINVNYDEKAQIIGRAIMENYRKKKETRRGGAVKKILKSYK